MMDYLWNVATFAFCGACLLLAGWGVALVIQDYFIKKRNKRRGYDNLI